MSQQRERQRIHDLPWPEAKKEQMLENLNKLEALQVLRLEGKRANFIKFGFRF